MKRRDVLISSIAGLSAGALSVNQARAAVGKPPLPPERWEHKFVEVPSARLNREEWRLETDEALAKAEQLADEYAADGWEYVSMQAIPSVTMIYMVFRRKRAVSA